MKKLYLLFLGVVFILSGCVARTYPLTRDRIDQDMAAGNRGFIMGKHSGEEIAKKDTRTVRVFEIEIGPSYKAKNKGVSAETSRTVITNAEYTPEEASVSEPALSSGNFQKYTVGKNDTLQKISQKFYGTTKKWMKIYEANRDVLKAPDRVYPGQVLNIPEEGMKASAEALKEPKENLK
jgi:nucleoid-associated protein YgaU